MAEEQTQNIEEQVQEPHGEEQAKEIDWKAEARKWEGRSKENSERIKALEKEMSEKFSQFEEYQQRAEKAEQEASSLRHKQDLAEWAKAAADAHGVPASILRGETAEEFMAHAEAIKASLTVAPVVRDSGEPKQPPKSSKAIFNEFMNSTFN